MHPTLFRTLGGALSLAAAVLSPFSLRAASADWPEFRGPGRQGVSTAKNVPLHWSASPASNVVWKAEIPGQGWSSPALKDGVLYLTTAVKEAGKEGLRLQALAVKAADGRILWTTELFTPSKVPGIHQKNGNASPTPIVDGHRVYVHFGHFGSACLDLKGKVIWKTEELPYTPVHGNGGSPALVDDLLVYSADGDKDPFVVALDKNTGKVKWKTARVTDAKRKFSFCTPLVIEVGGRKQIISPGSGAVCAYDPKTGAELWRVRYGEGYSVVPRPVYAGGLLFIATGYDRPNVIAIRPGGSGDLTDSNVAWTITRGAPNTPSMVFNDGRLYMVSDAGMVTCLDAQSGKQLWQERAGGNYSASLLLAEGRIYLQSEEGVGTVIKADGGFEVLAKNDLGERSLASYAVADNTLFIRTASHLYRIGASK